MSSLPRQSTVNGFIFVPVVDAIGRDNFLGAIHILRTLKIYEF